MNLLKILDDELRDKHLNDFEKARYIYLRCCEEFSFDSRYWFTGVFGDDKLHNSILYKKLDIENITADEIEVVCRSFSLYVLKPLIDNLTNLNCNIVNEGTHTYVLLDYKSNEWKLDATLGDFSRVKLDLPTLGFECKTTPLQKDLDDMDLSLGFRKKSVADYKNLITGDTYTENIISIGKILANSKVKYHCADTWYFFDEILGGFSYSNDNHTYLNSKYEFHKLIDTVGDYSFFDLSKDNGECSIKRITSIDYKVLKKYLRHK